MEKCCEGDISTQHRHFYRWAQYPVILDGSMTLLKYKLNNMCDADNRPANGAQRTMIVLIYHNML